VNNERKKVRVESWESIEPQKSAAFLCGVKREPEKKCRE
jgi:hypothetical protein